MFDDHEPRPRTFLSHSDIAASGIDFAFVTEQITEPTDWCFREPDHIIVVHRAGRPQSMELEFERGPSGRTIPQVGDIWVIPADVRYAALVEGSTVQFCEMRLPTSIFGNRSLAPRVRHRDPFLVSLIDRMSTVIGRDEAHARLLTESLATTLQLHLTDRISDGTQQNRRSRRTLTPSQQAGLIESLEDGLDSDISLVSLAAHAGMTVNVFIKAFTEAFGTTPHQFLLDRRVNRAKTLLVTTTWSVTDICHAVGFSSPSHFATTFRHRVGVSPTTFRHSTSAL